MAQDCSRALALPTVAGRMPPHGEGWTRRILALLLLALLALPLAIICVIIRLESPGPVLFRQTRIGRHGQPFQILKFRTMIDGKMSSITRTGLWLRRLGIDELPQIVNVARGEMALIGPRPLTLDDSRIYLARRSSRFDALPGVTGLAQATGRHLSPRHRDRLDQFYVLRRSCALDALVLLRTARAIMRALIEPQSHPDKVAMQTWSNCVMDHSHYH